ncbi:MAG: 4Fe-4S binding protein, partial [candidate division Zixibacteria bacterium]
MTQISDPVGSEALAHKPIVKRNQTKSAQKVRLLIQLAAAALCVWIGVEFHFFVKFVESGGHALLVERPPGVESFLPISSLMSLYYFFLSGQIHPYHPAGMFILVAILSVSLLFGKSFCSWICPVGLVSEMVADLTKKIFGKTWLPPRWLDYPLRSLKYLLLGFFVWSIMFAMTEAALKAFLDSQYNLVSDIKMYYFFADITAFALIVIGVLFGLSMIIRGFWCRYLCPYGALLGILSLLSLNRIRRNEASCVDCAKCAQVCPASIKVDKLPSVLSDECTSCLACIDSCPVANTLELQPVLSKKHLPTRLAAAIIVGLFVSVTGLAMLTGNWQ